MSCLSEETYGVYVDGELPAEEQRRVEAHLIQCQRCRGLILALQDEARLISEALTLTGSAARRVAAPRRRARGLALGLAPTLALGALAVSVAGWLLEQRVPGFSWLDPGNLIGAYEMAFDTLFTLRDTLPVLFDLGVAVGATVAMAAVLTFFVSALLKRMTTGSVAGLLLLLVAGAGSLAPARPAAALDLRWDQERVEVESGVTLDDTLVSSAETFEVNGEVNGDVIVVAERVTIRGRVNGNVFAAAREVLVLGEIDGSLHMVGDRCELEGQVTGNVYSAAEDLEIAREGRVGRDVHLFGEGVHVDGRVGRDLLAGAERVELRGQVDRHVRTYSERVVVHDEARIGGDLAIEVADHGESTVSESATIGGEVTETEITHHHHERGSRWTDGGFYLRAFVLLVSSFLVGLLLHAVVPGLFWGTLETGGDYLRCLGTGFVTVVAVPVLLVLCAITVVGIPIAILGAFAYLTLLFVSNIVVAALVGGAITGAEPEGSHGFGMSLLLGLVLVLVATNLPFVGGVLRLLVALAGSGLVVASAQEAWRARGPRYA